MNSLDIERRPSISEQRTEEDVGNAQEGRRIGEGTNVLASIGSKAKSGVNNFVDFCKNFISPQGPVGYIRRNSIFSSAPPIISETESEEKWKSNLKQIWSKDFSQLPVSSDLPRLVYFITTDESSSAPLNLSEWSQDDLVENLLLQLARQLEGEEAAKGLQISFRKYITGSNLQTGVFARQFSKFVTETIGGDSKVARVLKTCQQNIIAPVIIELKLNICKTLIFKDAGGWKIHISVRDDVVIITHIKKQKDFATPSLWSFAWMLRMEFPKDMSFMSRVSLSIPELDFSPEISQEKKIEIENMFQSLRTNE